MYSVLHFASHLVVELSDGKYNNNIVVKFDSFYEITMGGLVCDTLERVPSTRFVVFSAADPATLTTVRSVVTHECVVRLMQV